MEILIFGFIVVRLFIHIVNFLILKIDRLVMNKTYERIDSYARIGKNKMRLRESFLPFMHAMS